MRTSPKARGTRQETAVVRAAQSAGLIAERLAEGGLADRGDIRILTDIEWVGEVKDRERLNVHAELDKAIRKAGTLNTFLVWRRMVRRDPGKRRSQEGPVIVVVSLPRFLEMLAESVDAPCPSCAGSLR